MATSSRSRVPAPPADLPASTITFASASGNMIHAWYVPGRAGGGAVLLLHGVGSNRESMRDRAIFLHNHGFAVLAPDFEGHGESTGDQTTYGARESFDAAAAVAYLHTAAPGERVGVIGVSLGGAAALLGAGPLPADAYVFESVYPTIRDAVSNRLGTWLGPLGGAARLLTGPVLEMIKSKTGVSERELRPISRIGSIHAPLLLITGSADQYTPVAEAESLFAHAPAPKTMWVIEGAAHEDLHAYDPSDYERRVGGFLAGLLQTGNH